MVSSNVGVYGVWGFWSSGVFPSLRQFQCPGRYKGMYGENVKEEGVYVFCMVAIRGRHIDECGGACAVIERKRVEGIVCKQ